MKYSYAWLQDFIRPLPSAEKIADMLTMQAWEVEDVIKSASDTILDIAVLPNRMSDASGHVGVAREVFALLSTLQSKTKRVFTLPPTRISEDNKRAVQKYLRVTVASPALCPRYSAKVVFGVTVGPSPKWLAQRLIRLGVQPINNIVDITNYVMLETGQPLHAFDYDKLARGKDGRVEIMVRTAVRKESIVTLDGVTRILSASDLVIADRIKPLAIAGIKGGMGAGISKETKNIVFEAATFDRAAIYRSSKSLGIETDASKRFSAGLSPHAVPFALARAAYFASTIGRGKVLKGVVDSKNFIHSSRIIRISLAGINGILGTTLSAVEVRKILQSIGCQIRNVKNDFIVTVPDMRLDLVLPEDLIEEVGRVWGYGRIQSTAPSVHALVPRHEESRIVRDRIKDSLVRSGFTEIRTHAFVGETIVKAFDLDKKSLAEVENPIAEDKKYMRPLIIPRFLLTAAENLKYRDGIAVFESGHIFERLGKNIDEKEHIAAARIVKNSTDIPENFRFVKGALSDLLQASGLSDVAWHPLSVSIDNSSVYKGWDVANTAVLEVAGKSVGVVGVLDADVASSFAVPDNTVIAELVFSAIVRLSQEEHEFRTPSKYPEAIRDIAVLVEGGTLVDEVADEIARVGKSLVRDVEMFDYYEGEELPGGKKSLAFHIVYQSDTKTLTGEEVDIVHKKIVQAMTMRGWEIR